MASVAINYRRHRAQINHPAFAPGTMRTSQAVSPTGAAVAVRPRRTAIRFMTNAGQGNVGYV